MKSIKGGKKTREYLWEGYYTLAVGDAPIPPWVRLLGRLAWEGVRELRRIRRHLDGSTPPTKQGPSFVGALEALVKNTTDAAESLDCVQSRIADLDTTIERAETLARRDR